MSIPTQLPQFVTAVRPGLLQALALQPGQVLDARIVGPAPNGATQVEIRGQLLNLVLPALVEAGETIKLEVQGSGQQIRLAMQVAATASAPPPPMPAGGAALPKTAAAALWQSGAMETPALASSSAPPPLIPGLDGKSMAPTNPQMPPAVSGGAAATTPAGSGTSPSLPYSPPMQGGASMPASQASPVYAQPSSNANPFAVAASAAQAGAAAGPTMAGATDAVRPMLAPTTIGDAHAHTSGNPRPGEQGQPHSTPQAALAQMVQAAVPRQGSIIALTTALTAIAGKVVLPEPVVRAAQQVLAMRTAVETPGFDGKALQAAIRASGLFQEAALAKGQTPVQVDMKGALLALRQTLMSWLGQQAPIAPAAPIPPPLRGSVPRARGAEAPPLDPRAAPEEVGRQLLERTESALARVRLHQHASLPDPASRAADWSMDLPVMIGTQQTLMQLQIHRDEQGGGDSEAERGWQMRFALNLPEMGEVGAQVSLRAGTVGVMLWAAEPAASKALEAEIGMLREALAEAGLHLGAIIVRAGEPPASSASMPAGRLLDAST